MSDTVTILTSSTGHSLSKAFIGESYVSNRFNPGTTFTESEVTVKDLDGLADLLLSLEAEPTKTIIRGKSISDATGVVNRTKDQFRSAKRQWCMIDIDSLAWDGEIDDQQVMLAYAIQQLPAEFQTVDCWYHFSSSMGIKTGIRVHLWFWLERTCSDNELKTWLSDCPVDMRMFNPIQIHLTANPRFIDGAVDPYPNRSGLFEAGAGVSTVTVPSDLAFRSAVASKSSKQRTIGKSGLLDPASITRDPISGLAVDGREQLMFLLSNQVMQQLVTAEHTPSEEEVTAALWDRFCEEADISMVSDRGVWTINDAATKARARLQELESGRSTTGFKLNTEAMPEALRASLVALCDDTIRRTTVFVGT